MSAAERVRAAAAGALAALEASRRRIDDLNVYPVPDGDTGTNLTLTVRGIVAALERSAPNEPGLLAREVTRGALMSARGNSGVILSQIVRGAADGLRDAGRLDAAAAAAALRSASDAAYRAVRRPVEGTMLTVVREMAEAGEATREDALDAFLRAVLRAGEDAVERTPEQLAVLREAGVVDAGGAGLVEILRGVVSGLTGEPLPEAPAYEEAIGADAVHQELSQYRYCTSFVVEGEALDADDLERALEPLGDCLLVVGDPTALKVHVHTDDPGAAISHGVARGVVEQVEVANMHAQAAEREERLVEALGLEPEEKACEAVVVSVGPGNARLFEGLGAGKVIDGGPTMNPSTEQLLEAIEAAPAPEAIVLPNNPNVIMSAEQAARLASKPVRVVQTRSIPQGLAALVAYDPTRSAEANVAEIHEALEAVATGAVTVASRDAELDGVAVREGCWLGLVDGEAVVCVDGFDDAARVVLDRLLGEPRTVVTLLAGEEAPALDGLRRYLEEEHPEVELEVEQGGQPHYALLLSAE